MQEAALGRLLDQRLVHRCEFLRGLVHDLPLGCCRQGDPEFPLQPLQAVERDPGSILEERDHGRRRRVVLLLADPRRRIRGEYLPAQVAAQTLVLVDRRLQWRLAHHTHQGARFPGVELPLLRRSAARTRLARRQRAESHRDTLRAGVCRRALSPVTLALLLRRRLRGVLVGWRFVLGRLLALLGLLTDHLPGLLARAQAEQAPKPRDSHVLGSQLLLKPDQGSQRVQELLGVRFRDRARERTLDDVLQLLHVEDQHLRLGPAGPCVGASHDSAPRSPRKRFVSGYPSTSFSGRFASLV